MLIGILQQNEPESLLPLKNKNTLSTSAIKLYGFISNIKFCTNPLTPKEKST